MGPPPFSPATARLSTSLHRASAKLAFFVFLLGSAHGGLPAAGAQTGPAGEKRPSAPDLSQKPAAFARDVATVAGVVTDPSGALLPHAQVLLTGGGSARRAAADAAAHFELEAPAGASELTIESPGFAPYQRKLQLRPGQRLTLTATLPIATHDEELSVAEDTNLAATDPAANRDALIFGADKLATLSDDDNTLRRQLLGLAAGADPASTQFFIDGFSGGRFPPKETIREIRINQNFFSAQYDRSGFGRIDVFTKPGSNSFHGSARLSGNDRSFNAPNPYIGRQPPYHAETFDGEVNGALGHRTSFFLAAAAADNESNIPVNAVVLDPALNPSMISQAVPTPQTLQTYSLRLDRQLGSADTFTSRYEFNDTHQINSGVGQLTLLSQGFTGDTTSQTLQLGNTYAAGAHLVNETRFQYIRTRLLQTPNDGSPSLIVQGAFNGGGSPAQGLRDNQDSFEFQEYLSHEHGQHFLRAGARYRLGRDANVSTANYNGQYIFPTLTAYQITLRGQQQRLSAAAIRAQGGGATQFNLTAGTPAATVLVGDLGAYAEDEWKLHPRLTLVFGLRLESQNGIPDHFDPAPRASFTWAIGGRRSDPPVIVLHGGAGLFYDRFAAGNILQTIRQNGVLQRPYYVERPDFFPAIPDPSTLPSSQPTLYRLDPRFRSLSLFTVNLTADRTWKHGSASLGLSRSLATRLPVSLNVNAPLPGTYDPTVPGSGIRPLGGTRAVYQYVAEGINRTWSLFASGDLSLARFLTAWVGYSSQWRTTNVSGANTFPSNQYNLDADLGRSRYFLRQRLNFGATAKLRWGLNVSAYLSAHSGPPFNITIGQDINGDTQFNDRPAFATDLSRPSVVRTPFGNFDTLPLPSQTIIPINYGNSGGYASLQTQIGKTFHVGPYPAAPAATSGATPSAKLIRKYQLGFSAEATNLLNRNNPAQPIGVLSSPFFGRAIDLANEDTDNTAANRFLRLSLSFRF